MSSDTNRTPNAQQVEQQDLPGSAFHYSYHRLPAPKLAQINALFALRQQLSALALSTSDKNVAYTKLHWWLEEIERMKVQQARHPVTKQLAHSDLVKNHAELFEQMLSAAKMDLDYDSYPNYLTLCRYLDAGSGSLLQATSYICGDIDHRFGLHLGRAIGLTQKLQTLATDLHAGRLYLPISDLNKHELEPESFRDKALPENNLAVLEFMTQRCETEFVNAYKQLNQDNAREQRPNLAYASIHTSILKQIRRSGLECMQTNQTISPLRKLISALLTNPDKIVRQYQHE